MAANNGSKLDSLGSFDFPPRSSSSPKENVDKASGDGQSAKPGKSKEASTKSGLSGKSTSSGASSPEKPQSGASATARLSPSRAYALISKKNNKPPVTSKGQTETNFEIAELKKALLAANAEINSLKTKLRKTEEESIKRAETEKLNINVLLNNLRRKIQHLTEVDKEKDNTIKMLQADAKQAKHEAKVAMESTKLETSGKRNVPPNKDAKDLSKVATARAYLPTSRSANGRVADSASCQSARMQTLVDENGQLKERLRRALAIYDDHVIDSYKDFSTEELIGEINKLKGELDGLKTIHEKIQSGADLNGDLTSALLLEEMERMKSDQRHLKEEILSYYGALEKKELEIQILKEELERKERAPITVSTRSMGAIPKVPAVNKTNRAQEHSMPAKPLTRTVSLKKTTVDVSKSRTVKPKIKPTASATTLASSPIKPTTGITRASSKANKLKSPTANRPDIAEISSPLIVNGHSSPSINGESPTKSPPLKIDHVKSPDNDDDHREEFRRNVAAKKIQKTWKKHSTGTGVTGMITEKDVDLVEDIERQGCNEQDLVDNDLDNAAATIQAVARGHKEREADGALVVDGQYGADNFMLNTANLKDVNDSAIVIQSVARAHQHREEIIQHNKSVNGNIVVELSDD